MEGTGIDLSSSGLWGLLTNSAKDKGDRGEREIEALFQQEGITTARRALGAGRLDDVGDVHGIPQLCVQVAWRENLQQTIWQKLPQSEQQRQNRRVRFAATFLRTSRKPWIVVMTPGQFFKLYKYAMLGLRLERKEHRQSDRMNTHDRRGTEGSRGKA